MTITLERSVNQENKIEQFITLIHAFAIDLEKMTQDEKKEFILLFLAILKYNFNITVENLSHLSQQFDLYIEKSIVSAEFTKRGYNSIKKRSPKEIEIESRRLFSLLKTQISEFGFLSENSTHLLNELMDTKSTYHKTMHIAINEMASKNQKMTDFLNKVYNEHKDLLDIFIKDMNDGVNYPRNILNNLLSALEKRGLKYERDILVESFVGSIRNFLKNKGITVSTTNYKGEGWSQPSILYSAETLKGTHRILNNTKISEAEQHLLRTDLVKIITQDENGTLPELFTKYNLSIKFHKESIVFEFKRYITPLSTDIADDTKMFFVIYSEIEKMNKGEESIFDKENNKQTIILQTDGVFKSKIIAHIPNF